MRGCVCTTSLKRWWDILLEIGVAKDDETDPDTKVTHLRLAAMRVEEDHLSHAGVRNRLSNLSPEGG